MKLKQWRGGHGYICVCPANIINSPKVCEIACGEKGRKCSKQVEIGNSISRERW